MTELLHGHPADSDGLTCVFFARCPENSDIALYRSVYAGALHLGKKRARAMAEAYMSGRMGAFPVGITPSNHHEAH